MMTPNFCRTPWKLTPDAIVDADGNPLISRGDNPQDDLICETVVDNANEIAGLRITVAQNKGDLERAKFIATVDRKAMEAHEAAIAEWRRRAEKAEAALSREPRGCPTPGVCSCPREQEGGEAPVAWQDDPSADERWNAGCDFAMLQLCSVVGADPKKVMWDSATETLDGDVQSTIGKIIEAGLGENWQDRAHPAPLPADGWVAGAEAMREAAKAVLVHADTSAWTIFARAILALTPPTPPASTEGGTDA